MTDHQYSPGLRELDAETDRQFDDARHSFFEVASQAHAASVRIREQSRLLLLGMGGSHWANRMVVAYYRQLGIDTSAEVLSEYQRAPHAQDHVRILTSQSGQSGEILRFLNEDPNGQDAIGFTLNASSALGQLPGSLVGSGGEEATYAATRSLIVTLALHARILQDLGMVADPFLEALCPSSIVESSAAVGILSRASVAVFCGRASLQGAAEAAALTFMELARIPVLALEAGQFRHGPIECIDENTAVVFLRGPGDEGDGIDALAKDCVSAGCQPVILDFNHGLEIPGCVLVPMPHTRKLGSTVAALTSLQRVVIDAAALMVDDLGQPLRSTKVTSGERE